MKPDVVFVHAPSIYDFRKKPIMFGPVSDVVPSTPVFEMYPIGFCILSEYLEKRGYKCKTVNLAVRMLKDPNFDVEAFLKGIDTRLFAIDLHWLPHAHGSVEVAKVIKRIHPDKPIIFGGLSSTYFAKDLIQYPFVDMVMKGDSTEEPLRMLLDILRGKGGDLSGIPNLTWKDAGGAVHCQPITYVPETWNHSRLNYGRVIRSVLRDRDLRSYLPFNNFMTYPIVGAFLCRGGMKSCSICGGSRFAFEKFFGRPKAALREPETLAFDIADAATFFTGPIFLVGDPQAGGTDYLNRFLDALAKYRLRNMIGFEFWTLPPKEVFEKINRSVKNWSFEISCESQDEQIRRRFGKAVFSNVQFKQSIIEGLDAGAQRADVYMLTGIPFQTKKSIMEIPQFVEGLYDGLNGHRKKLLCFAAPLAPFVDPGSLAFEKPEMFGYKIVRRSLEDHRKAMSEPSWKHWLNYESDYIDRDSLVEATYDCGLGINEVKRKLGVVSEEDARSVEKNIRNAKATMEKVDQIYDSNLAPAAKEARYMKLKEDMTRYSMSTVCKKNELEWSVSALKKFKLRGFIKAVM